MVGVFGVDFGNELVVFHVQREVWRYRDKFWAYLPSFPDSHGGLNAHLFCDLVLREHDAVARFLIAAHDYGFIPQQWAVQQLHRSIKGVYVAVRYPSHNVTSIT